MKVPTSCKYGADSVENIFLSPKAKGFCEMAVQRVHLCSSFSHIQPFHELKLCIRCCYGAHDMVCRQFHKIFRTFFHCMCNITYIFSGSNLLLDWFSILVGKESSCNHSSSDSRALVACKYLLHILYGSNHSTWIPS